MTTSQSPPRSLSHHTSGLKLGQAMSAYLKRQAKMSHRALAPDWALKALEDLPPITARGFLDDPSAASREGLSQEYSLRTGIAAAADLESRGESTTSSSFSCRPAGSRFSKMCCVFVWPRGFHRSFIRWRKKWAGELFREDATEATVTDMFEELHSLGEIYGVDCCAGSDGGSLYGPSRLAALMQVHGVGGQALSLVELARGEFIHLCAFVMDGAPWNTGMEVAFEGSTDRRSGKAQERVQFLTANDVLAEIMVLMTSELYELCLDLGHGFSYRAKSSWPDHL